MSSIKLLIKGPKGKQLPIVGLRRPAKKGHPIFNRGRKELMGVSSCRGFPYNHEWLMTQVCGWCHCFREPENFGISGVPTALISESDFMGVTSIEINHSPQHDFIWACKGTNTQKRSKNLNLMLDCLPVLQDMGLTGYVVGHPDLALGKKYGPRIKFLPKQSWRKLMNRLTDCRFAFFPNVMDASPRFLGEALSLNVPAIVNQDIYGGWKYINDNTGQFFTSQDDVRDAILKLYDSTDVRPKEWWYDHYGPRRASKQLGAFISKIRPDIDVSRAHFA